MLNHGVHKKTLSTANKSSVFFALEAAFLSVEFAQLKWL